MLHAEQAEPLPLLRVLKQPLPLLPHRLNPLWSALKRPVDVLKHLLGK